MNAKLNERSNEELLARLERLTKTAEGRAVVERVLSTMKPRARLVLRMRLGLTDGTSLEAIGADYGVSPERIRAIAARARGKLNGHLN